ncbi:hypothetical protein B566_EDAN007867 [Ephemera danica]|nr:hypothetical protein B566_EDAN007867 [Ephemera danica]
MCVYSTMSTSLNTLSGVLVDDLLAGWLPYTLISRGAWLRVAAVLSGVICVALVFVVEHLGGVLQVTISLNGITIGSMLGVFTLGMFFPRATSKGALTGVAVSLLLVGTLVVASQTALASGAMRYRTLPVSVDSCPANLTLISSVQPENREYEVWPLLRLSYMYYAVLGCLIVLLVGLPVSLWSRDENEKCDPRLFVPLVRGYVKPHVTSPAEAQPLTTRVTAKI